MLSKGVSSTHQNGLSFLSKLSVLNSSIVNKPSVYRSSKKLELYGFADDASQKANSACIYLHIV